ncbi:MAG: hypothetical protein V4608_10810 [Bacteroidota bacterium]
MKKIILILSATLIFGCTSDEAFRTGKRQLEQQGYSNVRNTGYASFCCSGEDTFSTGFSCTDNKGFTVNGCFCSKYGKGVTIRFE